MSMRSVALAAMAACASLAHAATTYSVQQLPCIRDAAGCSVSVPTALSPSGAFVLGASSKPTDGRLVGTVWSGHHARHLVTPASALADQHAINDRGLAAGSLFDDATTSSRAVHWTADGHVRELPPLVQGDSAEAFGISADGDVAGLELGQADNTWIPVVWHHHQPRALGLPAGVVGAYPRAMSPAGVMVGNGYDAANVSHAILWSNGSVVTIGPANAQASGVNDSGQVVGYSGAAAFVATASSISYLSSYGAAAQANAIDSHGMVVGSSQYGSIEGRAVRWVDGQMEDLNSMLDASAVSAGWVLLSAIAIDESGRIIALAHRGFENRTAVLLVPSGS